MKKRKKNPDRVFVEVLQNGISVAATSKPVTRNADIVLSSALDGDLTIPFYPLPCPITLLEIRAGAVELIIDQAWEGIAKTEGRLTKILASNRNTQIYPLGRGEYASVCLNDIRVLIRIGPPFVSKKRKVRRSKHYRGGFSQFLLGDRREKSSLAAAAAVAVLVVGGFAAGLTFKPYHRFFQLEDLSGDYTQAFIAGNNLRTAPEALQKKLDRTNYFRSTLSYYRAFTEMVMGWAVGRPEYMFSTSRRIFSDIYAEVDAKIEERADDQRLHDRKQLERQGTAVLAIPSVVGESFRGSLIRLIDKIEVIHSGFNETLEKKRRFIRTVKKDPGYDYGEFRSLAAQEAQKEVLMQIQPWDAVTDEDYMYLEGEMFARRAERERNKITAHLDPADRLSREAPPPIGIHSGVSFASFVPLREFEGVDEKYAHIHASEWGKPQKRQMLEPLIGEIDPGLIEKTIAKYRFELQLCYERALRRDQGTKGTMQLKWRIDTRGRIQEIDLVSTDILDSDMTRCVRDRIASWRFPRPRRGAIEVRHGFSFSRAKG